MNQLVHDSCGPEVPLFKMSRVPELRQVPL